jgi:hypothetical protein
LPQILTSPTAQITQQQLTTMLANPWVPDSTKAAMLQMIQQRGQVQSVKVPGGTMQILPGTGQRSFIPEEVPVKIKSGTQEVDGRAVYDPATGHYHVETLLPGANNGPGKPGEPNMSTLGGMQAAESEQAGAKKAAEERAKGLNSIGTAISGDAFNAARQEGIIDAMQRIAPAADTGFGNKEMLAMNRMADQLGMTDRKAAPRELFNQLASKLLADQFANIRNMSAEEGSPGGKIFKSLLDIEEKANITPEDSLGGVQAKLAYMKAQGDRLKRWGDMADDYKMDPAHHGQIDEGFLKALRKDMAAQRFDDILPEADASSPTGMKPSDVSAAPAAPISKTINGKTYYQFNNGKVYDNPEGK